MTRKNKKRLCKNCFSIIIPDGTSKSAWRTIKKNSFGWFNSCPNTRYTPHIPMDNLDYLAYKYELHLK